MRSALTAEPWAAMLSSGTVSLSVYGKGGEGRGGEGREGEGRGGEGRGL